MKCPLCHKDTIKIKKTLVSEGQDHYYDWEVSCTNCYLIRHSFPADNYYGRKYYKTIEDVEIRWNEMISKYSPLA